MRYIIFKRALLGAIEKSGYLFLICSVVSETFTFFQNGNGYPSVFGSLQGACNRPIFRFPGIDEIYRCVHLISYYRLWFSAYHHCVPKFYIDCSIVLYRFFRTE